MTDQIELISTIQREAVYGALLAIVERSRAAIKREALLSIFAASPGATANGTDLAALNTSLGFDAGFLEQLFSGKRQDEPTFVADGLGAFFLAVVALAAGAVGHVSNPTDGFIRSELDRYLTRLRSTYAVDTVRAALDTATRMASASGSAASRVRQVLRSIGLTPAQTASLDAARGVLFAYLASPTRTMPAKVVRGRTYAPQIVRTADPAKLLARAASQLSAPQRAMLAKAMTPALDEAAAEQLLSRHASRLVEYRARVAAGHLTHATAEQAKLTAWRAAQKVGILPKDQRRFWQTAGDEKVRHSHAQVPAMNQGGVRLDQPFTTPLGECMTPPLEINCRCKAVLARSK